ncbi:hypothetical protein OCU04_009208 [Sclerotinia nivalis]|uniref:2EXR domain-containing protein n=1 Tax=Sclerotinia nivalis TaxID=352851 RepID=A0A9X0DGI7_9HELO|nr:hypothetical protein OCU04_009208 [Sclerotinia nivalis]
MSYALSNYPPTARRHNRSGSPPATGSGCYEDTDALRHQQQEEFPHLLARRQNRSKYIPRPLLPNYSIVPSTIDLEGTWIEPFLKEFPQFTKLPAELRVKIYKFACLEPRVIPIWPVIINRTNRQVEFRFGSETPAIMQVSHEARKESQKLDIYVPSPDPPFPFPRIWFKPTVDIICPVRNGRTLWTETQLSIFAQIIIHMKIERLGLDNFVSPDYKSEADLDEWNNFSKFAKWMNQNLRQIFLYTSFKQFNIRYQPLKLVESTKNHPEQSPEVLMMISIPACRRFGELHLMILDLEASRVAQDIIDEAYEEFGREKEKMPFVPGWLYEHRNTWNRPELTPLSAL